MKHKGARLVITWVLLIACSWLTVFVVYKASLWACTALCDAIEFEQTSRARQTLERVAANSIRNFITEK